MTPVIFRLEKDGQILAVFPTIPEGMGYMSCYAHIGQHGVCSPEYYRSTRPCPTGAYRDLYKELEDIGYKDLKVYSRISKGLIAKLAENTINKANL